MPVPSVVFLVAAVSVVELAVSQAARELSGAAEGVSGPDFVDNEVGLAVLTVVVAMAVGSNGVVLTAMELDMNGADYHDVVLVAAGNDHLYSFAAVANPAPYLIGSSSPSATLDGPSPST